MTGAAPICGSTRSWSVCITRARLFTHGTVHTEKVVNAIFINEYMYYTYISDVSIQRLQGEQYLGTEGVPV